MEIPVKAEVHCVNGLCGHSSNIVLNPVTDKVTHIVVKETNAPHLERIIPLDNVVHTTMDQIQLACTLDEFSAMSQFVEVEYIQGGLEDPVDYVSDGGPAMLPYAQPESTPIPVQHKRIPAGELAIRRGTQVAATDGHVGRVDAFLVDPSDGHITHLILVRGHLWGKKDITIPVAEIDRIEDDNVYLRLDKASIKALPAIPIKKRKG